MNILVTGANGQLGNEMRCIAATSLNNYIFTDVAELDITDLDAIRNMIHLDNIKVIVNCAAYTNVDKAEDDYDMADLLNNKAVENLAIAAKEVNATLIHISTDYVFQGDKNMPCGEDCETNPLGIYGKTKRAGEQSIQRVGCNYLIFRTAWLYSQFGKNFVKTMRQLTSGNSCDIQPCHSDEFPSKVKRPHFSVLDKTKLKLAFGVEIPYWKDSLVKCINELKENN